MNKVYLKTSANMSDESYEKLCSVIFEKYGAVSIVRKVDSTLIGGFELQEGDIVYDYSIRGQLKRLKKYIGR